ncbi:TAXI family TRAP transporter solute-binding subunit [Kitasatospora aureofaciens]|uniref:TAXI family TRAP transporter solute-binding subunit n=1 Tax=Kitasatospora aureofaciens TaxID=1894 RepID=UPI0037FDF11C
MSRETSATGRVLAARLGRRAVLGGVAAVAVGCSGGEGAGRALRLATGPEGGPYNAFGRSFAEAVAAGSRRLTVAPVSTAASVDNLRQLGDGSVDLALVTADVAEDAVLGRDTFARPLGLTALTRVYVNYIHLIVPANGPVRELADLAGRRVATGAVGSGLQVTAKRLLQQAALTGGPAPVQEVALGLAESLAALRAGGLDAVFWSGGVPTPAVDGLAQELPVRFVPMDAVAGTLRERYGPVYTAVTLPAGAYGLRGPVGTVGVGNYLTARPGVPDDAVRELLGILFDQWATLLKAVTAGARLEPRFAISTGAVPLHPGAAAYYRSVYG